ncbi:MAG: trimethylamine methyltransferase family protein [Candidatus Puniceispirillaceae bacterium]
MQTNPSRRGSRRRNTNANNDKSLLSEQMPWQVPSYLEAPIEPLSDEQIHAIHDMSLRVLEEIGILFLNESALSLLEKAGCDVDWSTKNVKFDRGFILEQIKKAPSQFTLTPRNKDHQIIWGGRHFSFGPVASAPNVMDLEKGRRVGDRQAFQDFLKLSQSYNCIHYISGYPVEPVDMHASVRHLHCLYDMLTLTDKVVHAYSLGTERIEDAMEMCRIAAGLSETEFESGVHMFTNINSSSPLKHDWPMLDGAMRAAAKGQAVIITPFTLAGAMAPVTLFGAVTQQNAEALAAIALLQLVKEGAPVVYGAFTSNVDMKSGAPAFGTPEYVKALQMSGQMARFYNLPWRGSNANATNAPDAQAIWESAFSLQGATQGGANVVFHAAGWLEGGLSASFEKFVIDCEMLQQILYAQKPLSFSEDELAFEAMREVGPHGHFFGAEHTQSRYKDAFYSPLLSDWRNFESWEEGGAIWTHDRAHAHYKQILQDYKAPPIDVAVKEELEAFVARRVEQGGAPTDF